MTERQPRRVPGRRNLKITASSELGFVWFQVPKVGTRSILAHFAAHAVPTDPEEGALAHFLRNGYRDCFHFAFVRNPFDRLVSFWHNKVLDSTEFFHDDDLRRSLTPFPAFIDFVCERDLYVCDAHLRLQSRLIDLDSIDFLGRHERFAEDFAEVCRRLALPTESVPQKNRSKERRDYRTYYDDRLAERVAAAYRRDFQIFGYTF